MSVSAEEFERLNDWLQDIAAARSQLSSWERGFFDDQVQRVEQYGANVYFSGKQWAALKKMYEKVTGNTELPPVDAYDNASDEVGGIDD